MVLVVDDSAEIREAIVELLTDHGYSAASAENGQDALRKARAQIALQAIVLDLSMPEMNGEQFRAKQLADPALAEVPVIVVSAERELREVAQAMRVHAALAKPFLPEALLGALRGCG